MFNAEISMIITFGLIAMFAVNVMSLYVLARLSDARIAAEVLKANKRLEDQIAARNRVG